MSRWIRSRLGLRGCMVGVLLSALALIVATPHLVEGQSIGEQKQEAEAIDARTYSQVQTLRHAVGLTNDDLATMDLTVEQAEVVLGDLLAWTERNQARLDEAQAEARRADRELREAQVALNVGPRDERLIRSMPARSEAVAQTKLRQRTLREEAGREVLASVRSDQRALWEAVHTRSTNGRRSESQQQLAADFQAVKQAPTATRENGGRLSNESLQRSRLRQARSNRLEGVQAAVDRVLPVPEELIEGFEDLPLDEAGQPIQP